MYTTVLVPHAGTPAGDNALKHAIFIAKSSSAKIILLNVVEQIQYPPTFAMSSSESERLLSKIKEANNEIKREMEHMLEKKIKEYKEHNIDIDLETAIGSAAEEILRVVDEKNIDLIVMAKRRKLKGVKKLLSLGSVSRKIVENVKCPVLLIDIENL